MQHNHDQITERKKQYSEHLQSEKRDLDKLKDHLNQVQADLEKTRKVMQEQKDEMME